MFSVFIYLFLRTVHYDCHSGVKAFSLAGVSTKAAHYCCYLYMDMAELVFCAVQANKEDCARGLLLYYSVFKHRVNKQKYLLHQ